MDEPLRRCPNCLAEKFFVDREELTFLVVSARGGVVGSRPPHAPVALENGEHVFCTGCGWHGPTSELLPPAGGGADHG